MLISLFDKVLNMTVLSTDNEIGPALWYFSIILLIIVGVLLIILLFIRSKQPENWEHKPLTESGYMKGNLTNLAESIRSNSADYSNNSPMKNHIEMMFFEKIRTVHGFSIGEIVEMKHKYPNKLRAVINDDEISNWILDVEGNSDQKLFRRNKNKKEMFLIELNNVLNKMETWGE